MRASIDKSGRIVIPRTLRDRIGLAAGGEVEIDVVGTGLRITPISEVKLEERDGMLVIPRTGTIIDDATVRRMVDNGRMSRQGLI